jgi:hypothetical protein
MFSEAEKVDLLIFLVPIAANPFEASCAICKSVGAYGNNPTLCGYKFSIHEKYFCIHSV